jgi:hypothetical protein
MSWIDQVTRMSRMLLEADMIICGEEMGSEKE